MKVKLVCIVFMVYAALISSAGCKKDNTKGNTGALSTGEAVIPADASGAFYAMRTVVNSGSTSYNTFAAQAWFDNDTATQSVDKLTVNGTVLIDGTNSGALPRYTNKNSFVDLSAINAEWNISGNVSLNIPAFLENDSTAYPAISGFNVPAQVSLNNALVISFTPASTNYSEVIFTISSSTTLITYSKTVSASSGNIEFTSAELSRMSLIHDQLTITATPVEYISQIFGGKKYYFEKQVTYSRSAIAY